MSQTSRDKSSTARRDDKLTTDRPKRASGRTPEPIPTGLLPEGNDDTFVIQEHHARRLHWDVRLEREGALVSWAVPNGLPPDPRSNHLAAHNEDHPLEYATFEGEIPRGEYGGGRVMLWDRGRYEVEKWSDREVKVTLYGDRAEGRYVFFRMRDNDWMVHRMDPPRDPDWVPMPTHARWMRGVEDKLPRSTRHEPWAYEMVWSGERVLVYVQGGRAQVVGRGDADLTPTYPELRAIGPALGIRACILDGEIVALDETGRPNAARLRRRAQLVGAVEIRRASVSAPVTFFAYDVLYLDGKDLRALSYVERRALLESLGLRGRNWEVPPSIPEDGREALTLSRSLGLAGVVAKRADSAYESGRSPFWRVVSNRPVETVLIGGWIPQADDSGRPAALLVGTETDGGLRYVGTVRTGLAAANRGELVSRLRRLSRRTSPFLGAAPAGTGTNWVRPIVGVEVSFDGVTRHGRLRHPALRRLV